MNIELLISIAALTVAIVSGYATWRVSRRQAVVQEQLLSLESRREHDRITERSRAMMRASIHRRGQNDSRLVVTNHGSAQARALIVTLDGVPVEQSEHMLGVDTPIRTLGPGARYDYRLLVHAASPDSYLVNIDWEDDTGEAGHWSSQLTV